MIEQHLYRGHKIEIELSNVAPGQFRWSWRIAGEHFARSRHTLPSEDVARSEAFVYAQVMVARLEQAVAARRRETMDCTW